MNLVFVGVTCWSRDKMCFHRTCCCSLRTGTITVAIISIVGSSLLAIFFLVWLVLYLQACNNPFGHFGISNTHKILTGLFALLLVLYLLHVALGVMLLISARKKDYKKTRAWLICTGILFLVHCIAFGLSFLLPGTTESWPWVALEGIPLLVLVYFLWVVHAFMTEIKHGDDGDEHERIPIGPA